MAWKAKSALAGGSPEPDIILSFISMWNYAKKLLFVALLIGVSFLSYLFFKLDSSQARQLSSFWYLATHSEAGYVIYREGMKDSPEEPDYIVVEDLFFDKKRKCLYTRSEAANTGIYLYKKIPLFKNDVYDINSKEIIEIDNNSIAVDELEFVPAWRVMAFGI
ncbi:hypothetical protein GU926_09995 [Nibribacter ruber]|uniref:Uncharacterized protein n=1 Tax=Nibribacter ruber TaxID=2698458 RepID=A0A6P1P1J1_9BACT|nr:hypothetical protein [Nibribacter ruber]QHL87743.1 hypothetical protein GU926_09995 [Nibribacter ruber]